MVLFTYVFLSVHTPNMIWKQIRRQILAILSAIWMVINDSDNFKGKQMYVRPGTVRIAFAIQSG